MHAEVVGCREGGPAAAGEGGDEGQVRLGELRAQLHPLFARASQTTNQQTHGLLVKRYIIISNIVIDIFSRLLLCYYKSW